MSEEGFSPRVEELGELKGEGIVPVTKIDDGGGSGGAPAILELAPGGLRVNNLRRDKLGEPLANQKRKKERRWVLSFTSSSDDTAAVRNRGGDVGELVLECVHRCASSAKGRA
jgi:hypothetical protein